jgi:hypothetical protein
MTASNPQPRRLRQAIVFATSPLQWWRGLPVNVMEEFGTCRRNLPFHMLHRQVDKMPNDVSPISTAEFGDA